MNFKKSFMNIFNGKIWIINLLIYILILLIPTIMLILHPELSSGGSTKNIGLSLNFLALNLFCFILSNGYLLKYIKDLIIQENQPIPSWEKMKEIFSSGFKLLNFYIIIGFITAISLLLYTFGISIIGVIIPSQIFTLILAALFISVILTLWITFLVLLIGIKLNFAEKEFDFLALLDINSAKKYLCKEYFLVFGLIALINILLIIFNYFISIYNIQVLYLPEQIFLAFFSLTCANLFAQIYKKTISNRQQININSFIITIFLIILVIAIPLCFSADKVKNSYTHKSTVKNSKTIDKPLVRTEKKSKSSYKKSL